MKKFLLDNGVSIFFGLTTITLTIIALRLKYREYSRKVHGIFDVSGTLSVILTREQLMILLEEQYVKADGNDEIWGQCISCKGYPPTIKGRILEVASKGVRFRILANKKAPNIDEFISIFSSVSTAKIALAEDNLMRFQGLSEKQVIISFSGVVGNVAILVKDREFVRMTQSYFNERWNKYYSKNASN